MHGIAVDEAMAVHEDPVRPLEPGEVADPALSLANASGLCPVSGAPSSGDVGAQVGSQLYQLCSTEHVAVLNRSLIDAEAAASLPSHRAARLRSGDTWTTGHKVVLIIRVSYPDRVYQTASEAELSEMMRKVNKFYLENSWDIPPWKQ